MAAALAGRKGAGGKGGLRAPPGQYRNPGASRGNWFSVAAPPGVKFGVCRTKHIMGATGGLFRRHAVLRSG